MLTNLSVQTANTTIKANKKTCLTVSLFHNNKALFKKCLYFTLGSIISNIIIVVPGLQNLTQFIIKIIGLFVQVHIHRGHS